MASNINPYNVDGTFPVAGQDNSSQGFRDNFTNTKNNFLFAYNEITDLQSKVLVTTALNGQTINNDMAGAQIIRPQLSAWTQTLIDLGAASSSLVLDFNLANFQKITTAGAVSISFSNWPASSGQGALGYGSMRVWVSVTNVAHTLTLPSNVTDTVNDIAGYNPSNTTITFDQIGDYVFDFSSVDGGQNYLIFDVTRNRSTLRDPNLYFNDSVTSTPTLFVGFAQNGGGQTTLNTAIAGDQGQNIISAMGSYNSVAFGNLTMANITNATLDTGKISGYTITSARGNLTTGTFTPVKSGDYLGYFNAVSYSGYAGNANVFQQMSTIAFYATGSNVTYGLGGNIAFFTSQDGEVAQHGVIQALGIENDQSVKVFGPFTTSGNLIEGGTYVATLATSGNVSFTANSSVSTILIDSSGSLTIDGACTITLPSSPADRQKIKIVAVAPITTCNVYPGAGKTLKYVATNKFASGNTAVQLTYMSSYGTWYVS